MQSPSILKELRNPGSPLHIGGIGSVMQTLCEKFSEVDANLIGWISSHDWKPNEKFCTKCAELYEQGLAWKFPWSRE